ncbi:hypothetical protein TMU3MR103_1596 [Tetragenococcus muriaticus 3MR10-3]|uniref:Uncharacterized protein n=1 Tax=Tetragenococcus muriaticus 3MR10-3 TaxID=1302648 RepID=A0A091CCG6_9ENTE|nr:hypothetical protein TMU3MR103_1596 [Tetragenococcus muriaticus 3MR10-3]
MVRGSVIGAMTDTDTNANDSQSTTETEEAADKEGVSADA